MASIFCPECGARNSYTLSKPNFCQGCGGEFGSLTSPKNGPKSKLKEESEGAVITDDYVPDISRLEYEIEVPNQKVTFESLVSNPLNPEELSYPLQGKKREKKMFKNLKDLEAQSRAECASSRQNPKYFGGGSEEK
jgi:hypothetical protein